MLVKQISVFVQNKPGRLSQITRLMAENGIDMTGSLPGGLLLIKRKILI